MDISKLKTGFSTHRLQDNDPYFKKECDFVVAINNEFQFNKNQLAQIVNNPDKKYLDEHEEKIVLSTIQWLGTPFGQSFLKEVDKMN